MLRQVLEYIYFVTAGPGLLLAAVVGLRSLRLSKQSMELTERRARLTATTRQIEQFAREIAPMVDTFEGYVETNNVQFFKKWNVHLSSEGVAVERTEEITDVTDLVSSIPVFLPVLNALSAWAAYFSTGVADEEVAYKTLGADFIHAAEHFVPAILVLNKQKAHSDLLDLYELWRGRFEQEFLVEDAQQTLARLGELDEISRRGRAR